MIVFAFFAAVTRRDPLVLTPVSQALPESLQMLRPMAPYVLIFALAMAFYGVVLDTYLDEFNAQIVLPVIITLVIIWERLGSKDFHSRNDENVVQAAPTVPSAFSRAVHNSGVQIGGLLLLQACSYCVGGIIEREGSALGMPSMFSDPVMAMVVLMLMMVLIGMVMDPFGALIMVTGTLAPIAYASGIDPIHFWLMALMSFELGYVTPPVALNHLLARQAVGDREVELAEEDEKDTKSFYYRHERYILPVLVQGTTLLLVAFGPLLFYQN
jgi:TRAP-type C4-dicarboxylate transport system permease large subunit